MKNKLLIIILSIFLILFCSTTRIFALTADDVKEEISGINNQIKELDKEIARYEAQLNETGQQKNTLNNTIKELTITRNKLLAERNQIQKKIDATGIVIKEIVGSIQTKEESIKNSEESLRKMLYSLYQNEKKSFLEVLLSNDKLTEFSKDYNNILTINEEVRGYISKLSNEKVDLSNSKTKKQEEQNSLNNLKKTLVAKEAAVLNTKKEKDTLLIQTKNQETAYQKLLAEQIKKRDSFEKSLEDYENQLKFILNPNSLPKPGSEVFSWPLDYILVTQFFGKTSSSGRLYASGSHSGMDFRAGIGTPVKAMATGIVVGVGDTDIYCKGASFGKWVFIQYNNGLSSVFGHLSAITAYTGQKVKAGDMVALSGNTGHSTGPHLHVSVYASDGVKVDTVPSISCSGKSFIMPIAARSSYLDPALYLPKINPSMIK